MTDKTEVQLLAQQAEIAEIAANLQIERLDEQNGQLNRIANALEALILFQVLEHRSVTLDTRRTEMIRIAQERKIFG